MRIIQISSTVPPSMDGVGDAVVRLNEIAKSHSIGTVVITGVDEKSHDNVHCIVRKWTLFSFPYRYLLKLKSEEDIILFHYPTAKYKKKVSFTFVPYIIRLLGFPLIFYLHEYVTYSTVGKIRTLIMLLPSNRILTSDSQNYSALRNKFCIGKKTERFSGIPNIVPTWDYQVSNIKNIVLKKTRLKVLYFGFLREGKGIVPFIELFENDTELSKYFSLCIVGGFRYLDKEKERSVQTLLENSKLVKFFGYIDKKDVCALYQDSHIALLPYEDGVSERRGSFLTAMAFGKIVVTTKPKYRIEGLYHRDNVWFIENSLPGNIREALFEILSLSNEQKNDIAQKARSWFYEYYSDEVIFKRLYSIIKCIV
ncbi:MAG: glycosyltransferase [Bacteroidetes bacterium]|nr:glycosyltransferase [Bacteroidota bacterium]